MTLKSIKKWINGIKICCLVASLTLFSIFISNKANAMDLIFDDKMGEVFSNTQMESFSLTPINASNGIFSVLGQCSNVIFNDCVASFEMSKDSKIWTPLYFKSYADLENAQYETSWKAENRLENRTLNMPTSVSSSYWEESDNSAEHYILSVIANGYMANQDTAVSWKGLRIRINGNSLETNKRFRLKLKLSILSGQASGWFSGRLMEPEISVSTFSDGTKSLTVTGNPVMVNKSLAQVTSDEFVNAAISIWPQLQNKEALQKLDMLKKSPFTIMSPLANDSIIFWKKFNNSIQDRAVASHAYWIITKNTEQTNGTLTDKCISDKSFSGMTTSNATVFELYPPKWNKLNSSLDFTVASSHYNEIGEITNGLYSLVMPLGTAKCLWGSAILSGKASITITNLEGKSTVITETMKPSLGNYYFNVTGFNYSMKTISVAFPSKIGQVITCIKGKSIKKVTAINPKCPAGYKKK